MLLVVPGLVAGLLIPAVGTAPKPAPASTVGMLDEAFAQPVATVERGEQLTLVNDSRLVHIIGPGRGGRIVSPAAGMPKLGFELMETNSVYTTGAWERPGTYQLTCSVHPRMTLEVVVTP
ncbi:MAG: hypothetical protein M3326_05370 [Actinomycetota bacterium]|nr:hypothetical protein [Actinomycetota bacterium]